MTEPAEKGKTQMGYHPSPRLSRSRLGLAFAQCVSSLRQQPKRQPSPAPYLEGWFWRQFLRLLSGWINVSAESLNMCKRAPASRPPGKPATVAGVLALLLVSCGGQDPLPTVPPGAQIGDLQLENCTDQSERDAPDVDCGLLIVAEDRERSDSRLLALPVKRIRSRAQNSLEPVFWLAGGPGGSNMGERAEFLLDRHDYVIVGYRGVDGSTSLDCAEVIRVLEDAKDVLTDATLAKVGDAYAECARRLDGAGVDIDSYTALDVIADLEAAREALGYDRINLLSQSYGTRVAYLYSVAAPESLNRSVMIAANPPGRMVWEPDQTDRLIEQYGELWSRQTTATARCADLAAAMRKVNQDMPRRWLVFPIRPGNVKAAAFALLTERQTAAIVFDAYCSAANGDASGLWMLSVAARFIFPKVVNWGDSASKAVSADHDPARDYADLMPADSILGASLGRFLWVPASRWPIEPIDEHYRKLQTSMTETLILSGNLDFSTPAENATLELLPHLPNGRQIVLEEVGHTGDVWDLQRPAVELAISSFLQTGLADESKLEYQPMDFKVSWGLPRLAKLGLAAALLAVVTLALVTWLVIRRIRRRRLARV